MHAVEVIHITVHYTLLIIIQTATFQFQWHVLLLSQMILPYLQPGKQIQQLLHKALTCTEQYAHRNYPPIYVIIYKTWPACRLSHNNSLADILVAMQKAKADIFISGSDIL